MRVVGFDPGLKGAIGILDGKDVFVIDMPLTQATRGRGEEIDLAALECELDIMLGEVDHAFIETVGAMPKQGGSSMFKFGYCAGSVRGLLVARKIPITMVEPSVWKPALGLSRSKDTSVARASQLYPAHAAMFRGPKGGVMDGRAEAVLIARYGLNILSGVSNRSQR